MRALLLALALAVAAGPAHAGFIVSAITALVGFFTSTALGTLTIAGLGAFGTRLLISVGASLLLRAIQKKPTFTEPGIRTQKTLTGSQNPQGFVLGRYATGGTLVCPPMSHGNVGGTPNAYHTMIIQLSDVPGAALSRVIIDSDYVTLGSTAHADYGRPVQAAGELDFTGYAWVKFYDGSQTVADPMLIAKYGSHPLRPWSSDMVGTGVCYAIVTLRFNRDLFQSVPSFRFEVDGIPLYDPRADTTVGGDGAQRWDDPSTWSQTDNAFVMIYNIKRGIALPDGSVWGGGYSADALPVTHWMGLMDACDEPVDDGDGGFEPAYRAGLEVLVGDEPAEVIQQLLQACGGQIAEVGGVWKGRVGGPGLPVLTITDDDIIAAAPETEEAFTPLDQTFNAVVADYPDPAAIWEPATAPGLFNADWEAEDGGRQLVAELQLSAVPYPFQVQRLMAAYIADERRQTRHALTLPPEADVLEPLDAIAWTSASKGYSAKVFELAERALELRTRLVQVSLRERDDADWVPPAEYQPVSPPTPGSLIPAPQPVEAWSVTAGSVADAASIGRRPALTLSWSGSAAEDADLVRWEVRVKATAQVIASGTAGVSAGAVLVSQGILPETEYEARGRFVIDRPSEWSDWLSAITGAFYITNSDFADGIVNLFLDQGLGAIPNGASLPLSPADGDRFFLTTDGQLYTYAATPGRWELTVEPGSINAADKIVANTITGGLIAASGIITAAAQIDDLIVGRVQLGLGSVTDYDVSIYTLNQTITPYATWVQASQVHEVTLPSDPKDMPYFLRYNAVLSTTTGRTLAGSLDFTAFNQPFSVPSFTNYSLLRWMRVSVFNVTQNRWVISDQNIQKENVIYNRAMQTYSWNGATFSTFICNISLRPVTVATVLLDSFEIVGVIPIPYGGSTNYQPGDVLRFTVWVQMERTNASASYAWTLDTVAYEIWQWYR